MPAAAAAQAAPELLKVISQESREWAKWGYEQWVNTNQTEIDVAHFVPVAAMPIEYGEDGKPGTLDSLNAKLAPMGYVFDEWIRDDDQSDNYHTFQVGTDKSSAKMGLRLSWEWYSMRIVLLDDPDNTSAHVICGSFIRDFQLNVLGCHVPSGVSFIVKAKHPPVTEVRQGVGYVKVVLSFALGRKRDAQGSSKNTMSDAKDFAYEIDGTGRITWRKAGEGGQSTADFSKVDKEHIDSPAMRELMKEQTKAALASIQAKDEPKELWACQKAGVVILGGASTGESVKKYWEASEFAGTIARGALKYVPSGARHPYGQWVITLTENPGAGDWIKTHLKNITQTNKHIEIKG